MRTNNYAEVGCEEDNHAKKSSDDNELRYGRDAVSIMITSQSYGGQTCGIL